MKVSYLAAEVEAGEGKSVHGGRSSQSGTKTCVMLRVVAAGLGS